MKIYIGKNKRESKKIQLTDLLMSVFQDRYLDKVSYKKSMTSPTIKTTKITIHKKTTAPSLMDVEFLVADAENKIISIHVTETPIIADGCIEEWNKRFVI